MQTLADQLLQPGSAYNSELRSRHEVFTKDFFESLIAESKIDVNANRKTVKEYNEELTKINCISSYLSKLRSGRAMVVFLAIVGLIAAIVGIFEKKYYLIPIGIIADIGLCLLWFKVFNPRIKNADQLKLEYEQRAKELLELAWEQMNPLNALFDSDMTRQLIIKTIPLLEIDKNFNIKRFKHLNECFGYAGRKAYPNMSTIKVVTGELRGNPFVIERYMECTMRTATYEGELYIEWEEYCYDNDGNEIEITRSETLHAQVTKPIPYYSDHTVLVYGNEAAPDLSFTHDCTHAERLSEKQLARQVKSQGKKIAKAARKSLTSGDGSFREMSNAEFDVLFNATDRNNEVQFRLLFTPLAQKNMLELMKNPEPYGDNFNMQKKCMLNYIRAEHMDSWDMDTSTDRYKSYDIDASFAEFVNYNTEYFKRFFFAFAPLLAIPLYQQHKPREYIYRHDYDAARNYTDHEAEVLANKIGWSSFRHERSATSVIIKTSIDHKEGKSDIVKVTAHSYKAVSRVDYVSVFGGDGHFHDVPVYWDEYIPVERTSLMEMREYGLNDCEYSAMINEDSMRKYTSDHEGRYAYADGIFACALRGESRLSSIP